MKNERRDAALSYVKRGWEIFPSPFGTKAGYSKDKHLTDAPWGKTKNAAHVREYWLDLPRANIGVPMGVGSSIWDLEIDTREGHPDLVKDGAESLAELEAKYGKLPATLMFVSPTGSVHRLFQHPGADVDIRSGPLDAENYPGIDCKGDRNMSIVPPSRTRKGVYRWLNRRRVAAAPKWLMAMVQEKERAPREVDYFQRFANHVRPMNMAEFTLAVAMVPNPDLPWDPDKNTGSPGWNAIGMAIYNATDGSAEGFNLFNAFSRRSRKYDAANTRAKWKAFHGCPPREIGAGTIFHLAEEAVPNWRERMYYDRKVIALINEFLVLMSDDDE
jgi:hypothetical protein